MVYSRSMILASGCMKTYENTMIRDMFPTSSKLMGSAVGPSGKALPQCLVRCRLQVLRPRSLWGKGMEPVNWNTVVGSDWYLGIFTRLVKYHGNTSVIPIKWYMSGNLLKRAFDDTVCIDSYTASGQLHEDPNLCDMCLLHIAPSVLKPLW